MSQFFQIDNNQFTIEIEKPLVFSIKDFLKEDNYEKVNNQIEILGNILKKKDLKYLNSKEGKLTLNSKDILFKEFENNYIEIKKLKNLVFSENFKKFFCVNLKKYFYTNNFLKKLFFLLPYSIIKKKISINFEISFMFNGSFLAPHTDSRKKLFTLMLYFPKDQNLSKLGTSFYESKISNPLNKHDYDNQKNYSEILRTDFVKNKLYGFIRSDISHHGVQKISNIPDGSLRSSINVNFILN